MVRKWRNIGHVDAAAHDRAAFSDRGQRGWYQTTDGRKDDRSVELCRRLLARVAGPSGALLAGKLLRRIVAWTDEGEHFSALPLRNLGHDMGGGPEAIDAEPPRIAGHFETAIANQARAQERCRQG